MGPVSALRRRLLPPAGGRLTQERGCLVVPPGTAAAQEGAPASISQARGAAHRPEASLASGESDELWIVMLSNPRGERPNGGGRWVSPRLQPARRGLGEGPCAQHCQGSPARMRADTPRTRAGWEPSPVLMEAPGRRPGPPCRTHLHAQRVGWPPGSQLPAPGEAHRDRQEG